MNRKLGLFRLGDSGYAVSLNCLLRVVDSGYARFLPLAPDGMAGIFVLDDVIFPLLDSGWLPGVASGKGVGAGFKVLVSSDYGPVALPADITIGIIAENRCELILSVDGADFFPESVSYRDKSYQVLNVDQLLMSLSRP